jgi:outer membrane receptor protein involved in Fe transport
LLILVCVLSATFAHASVFGSLRVLIHDPQHRPVPGAHVVLRKTDSAWTQTVTTGSSGAAQLSAVPMGDYEIRVAADGFAPAASTVRILSDRMQEVHLQLELARLEQSVEVSATPLQVDPTSSTPQTTIDHKQIARAPGADRTNSLSFITDYVPGAYVVHDQLHVRGGHQVTWAIDGVPVPNTNIASNVGPQFDPKDVDYLEAQRGSFMADYGDRTYGVFNVAPRSGFERERMAELIASFGSQDQTDNQLSFGDHTNRFAYYASVNFNRTNYGLEDPTFENLHNQSIGGGGFTSLTYNAHNGDQLRFVGSLRGDYFQIPNDPAAQAAGVRDREREQDAFASFTYLHPVNSSLVLTVTPFFHFNRAAFEGGPADVPIATDNRASTYAGGQVSLAYLHGRHNAKAGVYAFGQHDHTLFGVIANDGSGNALQQQIGLNGDLEALFVEDQFRVAPWLTFNGGLRLTRFAGELTETAASPRLGLAVSLPRLNWVFRGSYSRFYQAPPLSTISGPLLQFAAAQGFAFLPLRGERDSQLDIGVAIPLQAWSLDLDYFHTRARNFFDHDVLENANIFFPLTIDRARIRGFEASVRSPRVFHLATFHLVYSHQKVEGAGAVSGGLTDFTPPDVGYFFLDHDQRDTLSTGAESDLPWKAWVAINLSYGSGFLDGDGPRHLPPYHTVDLSLGKSFGKKWSARITATNIGNARYFIDLSNTFGGSHVSDPRMVTLQIRYRFRY